MTDAIKPTTPATEVKQAFTKEQLDQVQHVAIAAALAGADVKKVGNVAAAAQPTFDSREECLVCHQTKAACREKHVKMVVYPIKYPEFITFFDGIKINGVRYLSYSETDEVWVPESAQSMIANAVLAFEQNEKAAITPRSKNHSSGSIGRSGTGAIPANAAWR